MIGMKRKLSEAELNELVRQLCTETPEVPYCVDEWMHLQPEYLEPYFQAEEVSLWESPAISVIDAPSWVWQIMNELEPGAGRVVTHLLLLIGSTGHALSPRMMCKIAAPAQNAIDMRVTSFVVGSRAMEGLKEGEVTLLVLASVGPEPQADF